MRDDYKRLFGTVGSVSRLETQSIYCLQVDWGMDILFEAEARNWLSESTSSIEKIMIRVRSGTLADSARQHLEQARNLNLALLDRVEKDTGDFSILTRLALWEWILGLDDLARRHADEAVAALPVDSDAWEGQRRLIDQAWVYFATGATGRAFEILEQDMADPRWPGKKRELVWRRWEDLRADPRYAPLAAKYGLPD